MNAPTGQRQPLSPRSVTAYSADWELFQDWCDVHDLSSLPADPGTVLNFLEDCPASVSTLRRRVTAVDHHHSAAGATPPGTASSVLQALGRPVPPDPSDLTTHLDDRLRQLPSHGWTAGLFGRRDRVLLILTTAGVTPAELAAASAADLTIDSGSATFQASGASGGPTTLTATADPVVCGPCACARWIRLINLVAASASHRRWRDALLAAEPVTDRSPHLCRARTAATAAAAVLPLLPRIDQWGYLDLAPQPVGPRSLHRLAARMLSDLSAPPRRHVMPAPLDPDTTPPPTVASPVPVQNPTLVPFGATDVAAGWERRRWQKHRADEIDAMLDDLETRVAAALSQSAE